MINKTLEKKKILISVRLLPSLILVLASLSFSIAYMYHSYATKYNFIIAGGLFGFSLLFLLVDVGLEYSYKNKSLVYNIASCVVSIGQLIYFGFSLLRYLEGVEEASKRIFPVVILAVLLLINLLYRILTWLNKWKTKEKEGNDLYAAYIGFLGLGIALISSIPFSAINVYSADLLTSYVGIFSIIALGSGILEALVGALWLSFEKVRKSTKSNVFFYLTVFSLLANLAALITASFGYGYNIISLVTAVYCFSSYPASVLFAGLGLLYLSYLGKKQ